MKATLLALMALSGMAMAYTVNEANIITTSSSATFKATANTGIVVGAIDLDAFKTILDTPNWNKNILSLTFNNNVNFGLGQGCYGGVNEYRFFNGAAGSGISGGGNPLNGSDATDNWKASDILQALEGADSAAITFATQKSSGSYAMLTIAKVDDGGSINYTDFGAVFSNKYITNQNTVKAFTVNTELISKAYGYSGVELNKQQIIDTTHNVAKAARVPEPTTGTLSLLALAGLCIRRRK